MSVFRIPQRCDLTKIKDFAFSHGLKENNLSYVNTFLLQEKHGIEIAFAENVVLHHYTNGQHKGTFSIIFDENISDAEVQFAMEVLFKEAEKSEGKLILSYITETVRKKLEALFPGKWNFVSERNYAEYIYRAESLAKMSGKKFASKRNHISRFTQEYPDFKVVLITKENVNDAQIIAKCWLDSHETSSVSGLAEEYETIKKALSEWEFLNLCGILLYIENKPIAMSVASEISCGVWDIHFEKAVSGYPHVWPVIVKSMAEYLPNASFINREEDIGLEGLRKSKLSYRPDILNLKYMGYPGDMI